MFCRFAQKVAIPFMISSSLKVRPTLHSEVELILIWGHSEVFLLPARKAHISFELAPELAARDSLLQGLLMIPAYQSVRLLAAHRTSEMPLAPLYCGESAVANAQCVMDVIS